MEKITHHFLKIHSMTLGFFKISEKKSCQHNFKFHLKKKNVVIKRFFLKNIIKYIFQKNKLYSFQSTCVFYFLKFYVFLYEYQNLVINLENNLIFLKKITKIYFKFNKKKNTIGLIRSKNTIFLTFFLINKKKFLKLKLVKKIRKLIKIL